MFRFTYIVTSFSMSSLDIWYNLNQNWNVSVTPEMGEKTGGEGAEGREIRVKDGHQLPNWTMFSYVCLQMNQTRQVNEYIN